MLAIPTRFHFFNSGICFVLSSVFNWALLWLVEHRTSAEMTTFRPILLLCTWVDLVYSAVLFVVRPVTFLGVSSAGFLITGPLGWVPQPYNFALLCTYLLCRFFSIYSLAAPFIYRYFIICRGKKKWGLRHFLAILALPTVESALIVGFISVIGYTRTEEDQRRARQWLKQLPHAGNTSATGASSAGSGGGGELVDVDALVIPHFVADQTRLRPFTAYAAASYLLTYVAVVYCGWRIYRHLTHMASGNVSATQFRALQLQLSMALLLQAVVPLVVGFAPTLLSLFAYFLGLDPKYFAVYITAVYAWVPVANPLITMFVIKVYRDTVLQWLKIIRPAEWLSRAHTASVQPASQMVGPIASKQTSSKPPPHGVAKK